jgi:O-6-methylguanine DNA methyltransferase
MPRKFSKRQITSFKELSSFRKRVYQVVRKIPSGKTLTYKEIAKEAGSPRAWRAVGNILNKNKNPKIPCHRVIRSNGKIGGYNKGTKKKIYLLKREGITINMKNKKVKIKNKNIKI